MTGQHMYVEDTWAITYLSRKDKLGPLYVVCTAPQDPCNAPKSFVKDVVTPKLGRADAAGPSSSIVSLS